MKIGKSATSVRVVVYPIAGKQLFFRIPDRVCKECDLTLRTVKQVIEELGPGYSVTLEIKPWLNNLLWALWRGGWHPPVVTIQGRVFSQGVVPEPDKLKAALLQKMGEVPVEIRDHSEQRKGA